MSDCFLVTGAAGFLGAWVTRELIAREARFVLFDRDPDLRRLDQLVPERPRDLQLVTGDVTDVEALERVIGQHGVNRIIHLAALQIPACRNSPLAGATVNVLGTLAVFEAARRSGGIGQVVYASSAAVIGPEERYAPGTLSNDAPLYPATHYGVFKQCNEGNAAVYFRDHGLSSIGLRPWTCYGVGRDEGVTADATRAIKAALTGRGFTIRYSGRNALQYARDVAAIFVDCASLNRALARAFNLRGSVVAMTEFIAEIESLLPASKGLVRLSGGPIPVACDLDDRELQALLPAVPDTPLREGISETVAMFDRLRSAGRLDLSDLNTA
jgi:nucleoside-diphosphate-sugar epimerase